MNENLMKAVGFGEQVEKIKKGKCPFCGKEIGEFKDALSRREFEISGLCQQCQDETF